MTGSREGGVSSVDRVVMVKNKHPTRNGFERTAKTT